MAQHVLDSVAIVNSALVQNEHDPWYQYQESERQQFSTFVTTSLSIINAYAMAQQTTNVTELSRAITDLLVPYWDDSFGGYEILTLDDRYHAMKLGEYAAAEATRHPLEDIFIAYVCQHYYPGSIVCGYNAPLYGEKQLTFGYQF